MLMSLVKVYDACIISDIFFLQDWTEISLNKLPSLIASVFKPSSPLAFPSFSRFVCIISSVNYNSMFLSFWYSTPSHSVVPYYIILLSVNLSAFSLPCIISKSMPLLVWYFTIKFIKFFRSHNQSFSFLLSRFLHNIGFRPMPRFIMFRLISYKSWWTKCLGHLVYFWFAL